MARDHPHDGSAGRATGAWQLPQRPSGTAVTNKTWFDTMRSDQSKLHPGRITGTA